jgi:membrane-associated phospholipid phosphatase
MAPTGLDRAALLYARTRFHAPGAERLIAAYSRLGEHGACWLALGAIGALTDNRPVRRTKWLRGVRIVAAAYGLNFAVKLAVHRRRPELVGLPPLTKTVSRLSFPSAHATTSFAAAWAFSELAPPAWLYGAATAFGLSRPYLGVHYPSDVLGGAALGTVIAAAWPQPRRPQPALPQPRRPQPAWPQPRRPQPAWPQKGRTP